MDENKQAAAEEVKALTADLDTKLAKLRKTNSDNRIEMAKDLSKATETFYEKMSNVQKENMKNIGELNPATAAAKLAAQNELARAQAQFDSKIVMLTNTVAANAKKAEHGMARLTGVVHSIGKASAKDRELIKEQTKSMEADLNKAVERAADNVFKIMEGKRQKIADNYLSLKAYAVSAADKVEDYVSKGKGRALSSIG